MYLEVKFIFMRVLMATPRDESGVVLNPGDEVLAVGVSSRWIVDIFTLS